MKAEDRSRKTEAGRPKEEYVYRKFQIIGSVSNSEIFIP
jgi:hypothetical protein